MARNMYKSFCEIEILTRVRLVGFICNNFIFDKYTYIVIFSVYTNLSFSCSKVCLFLPDFLIYILLSMKT
jgi:hypothetical protein